jgi:hypothetical protein
MKKSILTLAILLMLAGIAKYEPFYTDQKICNAIWYVEGGKKANQEYGINPQYVICGNHLECKNVCIKTVAKWRRVYNLREYTHYKDFLTFLSYKYCPPNHVIWLKNLKFFLRKLK